MARQDVTPYFTDGIVTLHHGNALALPLEDATVDLVVTSPPYFGLRSYQDAGEHYAGQIGSEATPAEFVDALIAATAEMVRVLKPSGSIWVNLGDKYASTSTPGPQSQHSTMTGGRHKGVDDVLPRMLTPGAPPKSLIGVPWRYAIRCIDELGLILRAEVVWSKPNGLPESVTDRVRRSHETWFHFTKEPRYFSAVDEIREDCSPAGLARREYAYAVNDAQRAGSNPVLNGAGMRPANPLGKLPGSVWTIATQPLKVPASLGIDHFAAFPMEWPRRIIKGWSPAGGIVLDPFGGTGTTALVARTLGRRGIYVDMSEDYCRLAKWRTTDRGQIATAMKVEKVDAPIEGQEMFELEGIA